MYFCDIVKLCWASAWVDEKLIRPSNGRGDTQALLERAIGGDPGLAFGLIIDWKARERGDVVKRRRPRPLGRGRITSKTMAGLNPARPAPIHYLTSPLLL